MHNLYPCHHGCFVHEPSGQWQRLQGKEAKWFPMNHPIHLLKHLSDEVIFWWAFTYNTNGSTFFAHIGRFISIPLPSFFVINFPMCSFQLPHYLAKPLAIAHKSVCNCMPGHFSFWAKNITRCLKFCSLRFPFTTVLQGCPRRAAVLQLSTFRWWSHTTQNLL